MAGAVLLQATSCAVSEYRDDRFALTACPPAEFGLPDDARDGPYHLARTTSLANDGRSTATSAAFTHFVFTDMTRSEVLPIVSVRLNRGATCSLDVLRPASRTVPLRLEQVEAIATVLLRGVAVQPIRPARSVLIKARDLERWAVRPADADPGVAPQTDAGAGNDDADVPSIAAELGRRRTTPS